MSTTPKIFRPEQIAFIDDSNTKAELKDMSKSIREERKNREWNQNFRNTLQKSFEVNCELYDFNSILEWATMESSKLTDDLAPVNYVDKFDKLKSQVEMFKEAIFTVGKFTVCKYFAHLEEEFEVAMMCDQASAKYVETMYRVLIITGGGIHNRDFELKLHLIHKVYAEIFAKEIIRNKN